MGAIEQGLLLIHFELVITTHLDTINEIKDSEQACKQVKHDIEMFVIFFISLISSESSALSTSDFISAVSIVQGITQPLNDRISQPFTVPAFDSSSTASISSVMTQLLGNETFKHSIPFVLDSSSAVMVPPITRQLMSGENSAGTFSVVLQQQSVVLTLYQTPEPPGVMILSITLTGKSEHHVFTISKLMLGVSMSMTLFFWESATTLSSSMTFTMILLANVSLIVPVVDNAYNDKGLKIIMKSLKSVFQYSLSDCAQFSGELKLLNDYFKDYKTGTGLDENALNQDFKNIQDEN